MLCGVFAGVAHAQPQAPAAPPAPITLQGNVERGQKLAMTCSGCHEVSGSHNAYPSYHVPKLGGQHADYIEVALQGYRSGLRSHPTMQAQASTLTNQDIADIAAFFASLAGDKSRGSSGGGAALVAAGEARAMACVQCHGQGGVSPDNQAQWPTLAGQHASYLVEALKQYKSGHRKDALMATIVPTLDDAAIEELAAYFAAQPWLYTLEQ